MMNAPENSDPRPRIHLAVSHTTGTTRVAPIRPNRATPAPGSVQTTALPASPSSMLQPVRRLETDSCETAPELVVIPSHPDAMATFLNAEYQRILNRALIDLRDLGRLLIEARTKIEPGTFQNWIETHCVFSYQSAWNYMQLAEHWEQIEPELQRVGDPSLRKALALIKRVRNPDGHPSERTSRSESASPPVTAARPVLNTILLDDVEPRSVNRPLRESRSSNEIARTQVTPDRNYPEKDVNEEPDTKPRSSRNQPEPTNSPLTTQRDLKPRPALRKALASTSDLDLDVEIYKVIEPELTSIWMRIIENRSRWLGDEETPSSGNSPLLRLVNFLENLGPPRSWILCTECKGSSTFSDAPPCSSCNSVGYHVSLGR